MRKLRSAWIAALPFAAAVTRNFTYSRLPNRLAFDDGGESYSFFIGDTSERLPRCNRAAGSGAVKRLTLNGGVWRKRTFKSFDLEQFLASVNGEVLFKGSFRTA